jgi:hypothetical protein
LQQVFPSWARKVSKAAFKFYSSFEELQDDQADPEQQVRAVDCNALQVDIELLVKLVQHCLEVLGISKDTFAEVQLALVLPSPFVALQLSVRSKLIRALADFLPLGVFLVESACVAALGSAHGTALVVDFSSEGVEVAAVSDFNLITEAVEWVPVVQKGSLLENLVAERLLEYSQNTMSDANVLCPADLLHSLKTRPVSTVQRLLESCPAAKEDSESVQMAEGFAVPVSLLKDCFDDIFMSSTVPLLDVIESVLQRCDADRRPIILNHIILAGPLSACKLLRHWFKEAICKHILAVSDFPSDTQPSTMALRGIPDYYQELAERGAGDISWFGATLTGKYAFSDPKTFVSTKANTN